MGQDKNMYEINHDDINQSLEDIEFDYNLPSKMPFEVVNIETSRPSLSQPLFTVDYMGEGEKYVTLDVTNSNVNFKLPEDPMEKEEVTVNEADGVFMKNDHGAKILAWEEKEVSYELMTNSNLSKDTLVNVAESFD